MERSPSAAHDSETVHLAKGSPDTMTRILRHVRSNIVAYVALFVALGGTGWAATSLPKGSVGPQQLNHKLIGGYIRAWATVNPNYQVLASSGGAKVVAAPPAAPVTVIWPGRFPRSCTAVATPSGAGAPANPALVANYERRGRVQVFSSGGTFAQGINVAVLC